MAKTSDIDRPQAKPKRHVARLPTAGAATDTGAEAVSEASAPRLSDETRILQNLRRIIRAVDLHSRKLASVHQITTPQLVCLLNILETEPTTAARIAKSIHLSSSTVIGILDRLQRRGMIDRNRDRKDRRVVNITLTGSGRELTNAAPSPLQEQLARSLSEIPELERLTILAALDRVVELMSAESLSAAPVLETGPIDMLANERASGPMSHEPNGS